MDGVSQVSSLSDQLRLVASKGQLRQVEECLRAGAAFTVDQDGRTALHYAALNGFTDVTKFLIEKGCDINIQDDSGYTALHRAASQGHVDVITVLLECSCDLNTQDEHGNAAIHEAAWNGFSKTLELLVKYEVSVNVTNKAGFTALHLAAQNGHNESTRVLLYAACNSDAKNNYGDTALHTAARYGHAGVTRILISARAKLNEQNKNGDTALHIAAALKRRKIAKLLVESGTDVSIRNKQNENTVDVAKRKDHHEIISIVQAFLKVKETKVQRAVPLREVNFKEDVMHDLDGPVVVPDKDPPEKQDKSKKFFFFKKKKNKEKDGGVTQQKTVPGCSVHVGKTPVQGFFSKYVPREGVQYYRDLAGNVKKGPVGYTPQCNCLPAVYKLEKQVNDTKDYVYGQMQSTHQAMQERMDQLDHKSSLRVQSLEKYTRDRFNDEEHMCNQRISQRLNEQDNYYTSNGDQMKMQIQDWLEEKLEGYGHCLHHHHDDSVLPNENIFSDIHETANGRLFKSRSDETLSQSDNHSGRFRKRDFYESRTAAMQQMRAWQVPSYSKDRNKIQVHNDPKKNPQIPSKAHLNTQTAKPENQYPMEPKIEVRNSNRNLNKQFNTMHSEKKVHLNTGDNTDYVTMTGYQHATVPKQTHGLRKSQSSQPIQRQRGPVNHSTPKSSVPNPYDTIGSMVRSHTDSGLSNKVDSDSQQKTIVKGDYNFKPKLPNRPSLTTNQASSSRQLSFQSSDQDYSYSVSNSSHTNTPSANSVAPHCRNSTSSGQYLNDSVPKPTFTTFGYDGDASESNQDITDSPKQKGENFEKSAESAGLASSPRLNTDVTFSNSQSQYSQPPSSIPSSLGLHESQRSLGFVPTHTDDNYMDMSFNNPSHRLHQRARSADGLLDDDGGFMKHRDGRTGYSGGYSHQLRDSASVHQVGMDLNVSKNPNSSMAQSQLNCEQPSYPRTSAIHSASPSTTRTNFASSRVGPPTSPKPKNSSVKLNPYSLPRDLQNNSFANNSNSENRGEQLYGTVRGVKMATDSNHNVTVKADVHVPGPYYGNSTVNGRTPVRSPMQLDTHQEPMLEARSQTAYQTYLTEDLQVQSGNMYQRENSPNVCNNSKEDSSSNPDSGYSSKIYGNRANSATPASTTSTPSSSFSTDRGISLPSNNNSPQSQYSNGDYDSLPKTQYYDDVQNHMQSWYQRKLQETTQKVYDSWRNEQSPAKSGPNGQYRVPVRTYGKSDYGKSAYGYSQPMRQGQSSVQQMYGDYSQTNSRLLNSHIAMHGSDV